MIDSIAQNSTIFPACHGLIYVELALSDAIVKHFKLINCIKGDNMVTLIFYNTS